jgi:single-stranded-DNA-specific exonuclease
MVINESQVTAFSDSATKAAKTIRETVEEDGLIHVFSHLDADGVAAAGIIGKALARLNARFRIRITQWIEEKIIEVLSDKPQLIVFSDLGSGYVDLLKEKLGGFKIVILDHHQIVGEGTDDFVHVNPHLHGIDGARDISGAGVAYFVAKAIDKANMDSAPVAIVGALGDMQDKYDQRMLGGLNEKIVEDAVQSGSLTVEKDLIFFGRETRPIHRMLASTTSPFVPGISGEEDKSLAFLANLGIKPRTDDDKWRALRDLSDEEKKRLCSALADHLLSKGLRLEVTNLIGHVYVLNREEPWTPLRDGREFATLLNATGRMDKSGLGVAVCMGDRADAFEAATKVLDDYRRSINKYLGWVMEKPERMRELENIYVVYGENFINDKIVGAISSILASTLPNPEKPLIAFANVEEQGLAKISARTIDMIVAKGVNLGDIMQAAAERCDGKGGGHNVAAGAQVPLEKIDDFIGIVNELIGQKLKGENVESRDTARLR